MPALPRCREPRVRMYSPKSSRVSELYTAAWMSPACARGVNGIRDDEVTKSANHSRAVAARSRSMVDEARRLRLPRREATKSALAGGEDSSVGWSAMKSPTALERWHRAVRMWTLALSATVFALGAWAGLLVLLGIVLFLFTTARFLGTRKISR